MSDVAGIHCTISLRRWALDRHLSGQSQGDPVDYGGQDIPPFDHHKCLDWKQFSWIRTGVYIQFEGDSDCTCQWRSRVPRIPRALETGGDHGRRCGIGLHVHQAMSCSRVIVSWIGSVRDVHGILFYKTRKLRRSVDDQCMICPYNFLSFLVISCHSCNIYFVFYGRG